jgi:periplasmic protein CpxP/Spy
MKKFFKTQALAIAFTLAMAVAAPFALAQTAGSTDDKAVKKERRAGKMGKRFGRRGGHGGGFGASFRHLDLTDAQKAQLKQIRASHSESIKALRQQIREKRQAMRESFANGAFNESLASQRMAEIAPLQAKLMGEQFRIRQESLSVLTAEQKAKLEQSREQFKQRIEERRSRRKATRS